MIFGLQEYDAEILFNHRGIVLYGSVLINMSTKPYIQLGAHIEFYQISS